MDYADLVEAIVAEAMRNFVPSPAGGKNGDN